MSSLGLRALIATELLVPRPVTFAEGIETRSWQLRAVVSCTPDDEARKRVVLTCRVEDGAVSTSVLPRLDGRPPVDVEPLLAEMAAALRAATVSWTLTPEGRQVRWMASGLPDAPLGPALELQLERAMAGLVLERSGPGPQWVETRSPLLRFPDAGPAAGVSQWVHAAVGARVDSAGEAVLVDADTGKVIQVEARSRAERDAEGRWVSRSWNVDGEDDGTVVYHHAGWWRRLAPGEAAEVGPSREVRAPGEATPAHLPEWPPL